MKPKRYPRIYCPSCKAIVCNVSDKEMKKSCKPIIINNEADKAEYNGKAIFITCPKCKKVIAIENNLKSVSIPEQKIGVGATA